MDPRKNTTMTQAGGLGTVSQAALVDHINNYYQVGPIHEGRSNLIPWLFKYIFVEGEIAQIYTAGNLVMPDFHTDDDADNWHLWEGRTTSWSQHLPIAESVYRKHIANQPSAHPVTVQTAREAYTSVMQDVGANARLDENGNWVFNLDSVDQIYLEDVMERKGPTKYRLPDSHSYPEQDAGTAYPDRDEDGMSDLWEKANNLDPYDSTDGKLKTLSNNEYTNLEVFLNGGCL